MDQRQAMAAFGNLTRIAPDHVGSRLDFGKNEVVRSCLRCGAEDRKRLPLPIAEMRGHPERVPADLDEELFGWMRAFAEAHRGCVAGG